jgi:hypothetical protein
MNSSFKPVVPMTMRAPEASAASASLGVQAAFVKSMMTSGLSCWQAAGASLKRGMPSRTPASARPST